MTMNRQKKSKMIPIYDPDDILAGKKKNEEDVILADGDPELSEDELTVAAAGSEEGSPRSAFEGLSELQLSDMRECIGELRKLADRNGGYVTYEEMNHLLPQNLVDAASADACMDMLENYGVQLLQGEDVASWKAAKESGDCPDGHKAEEDSLCLYMRQMGKVVLLKPEEEAKLFRTIDECAVKCKALFNRFRFASVLYASVLDRLEGRAVRFDHVVSDRYEGGREAYLAKIPEFRKMLRRTRGRAALAECLNALCFTQKQFEALCADAEGRLYLPYKSLWDMRAGILRQRPSRRRNMKLEKVCGKMAEYEKLFGMRGARFVDDFAPPIYPNHISPQELIYSTNPSNPGLPENAVGSEPTNAPENDDSCLLRLLQSKKASCSNKTCFGLSSTNSTVVS